MAYFRTYRNPGRWGECLTCDSGPGERCRHLINSTVMATVHEGRQKLGRIEFETARADYERRQQERQERARQLRIMREAEVARRNASIEKHGYIKPNINMALSLDDPPQPAEKPPGARLVRQTVHQDWQRDEVILENEYTYPVYKATWNGWVANSTTTTGPIQVNYTIQDNTWREWTAYQREWITRGTITTGTGGYVWPRWIEMGHAAENAAGAMRQVGEAMEDVAATQRRIQERADLAQARREAANRERLAREKRLTGARERASELLDMVLSDTEKAYRETHGGRILVRSQHGHLYEIDTRYGGVHGNITRVDEHGCILGRLCVAPGMYDNRAALPLEDGYVGQYLALRFNEDDLLAKANWSGRRECQNPGVPILGQQRVA